jgi:hypothetical protein
VLIAAHVRSLNARKKSECLLLPILAC